MAGHRKRTGKPLQREVSMRRRAEKHWARLEHAKAPLDRLAAAHDLLRTALASAPAERRREITDRIVNVMSAAAADLIEEGPGS